MSVEITKTNKSIFAKVKVRGFFKTHEGFTIRNKFTRNMGYIIDGLIRLADVSVYDLTGTARTMRTSSGGLLSSLNSYTPMGIPIMPVYGAGTATPTVTDNNLQTPLYNLPTNYIDTVEGTSDTQLVIGARFAPDSVINVTEAGIWLVTEILYNYRTLLSRTVLSTALSRTAYTEYFDAYVMYFPANFTRWFVRMLAMSLSGIQNNPTRGRVVTAYDGAPFVLRASAPFAGTPDVRIGSDNTLPSPTDYALKAPVASLASQSQTVEVDTTLQEVRVVRQGTYTPTTNTVLGEIGLVVNATGFRNGSATNVPVLLARVALDTPITLTAGSTYTIGIVLAFS